MTVRVCNFVKIQCIEIVSCVLVCRNLKFRDFLEQASSVGIGNKLGGFNKLLVSNQLLYTSHPSYDLLTKVAPIQRVYENLEKYVKDQRSELL